MSQIDGVATRVDLPLASVTPTGCHPCAAAYLTERQTLTRRVGLLSLTIVVVAARTPWLR